jgi:Abortive infection alpha
MPMIVSDEEAKAAQEVARIIPRTLDTVERAGTFLVTNTVATIVTNIVGMGADWSAEARKRNLGRLQEKTARILDGVAKERLSEPSLSVVKPLLEAAADEGREELQALWAALLANALIDGGKRVRRDYFEAVRQMEPADALVFHFVNDVVAANAGVSPSDSLNRILTKADQAGLSQTDTQISLGALVALKCISWNQFNNPIITSFGLGLLAACKAP